MTELQIVAGIEKSKQQGWSELADRARDGASAASDGHLGQEDQRIWEELKERDPRVFIDWGERVKLGRLIAEGGQAHIYEAELIQNGRLLAGRSPTPMALATKAPHDQRAQFRDSPFFTVWGGVVFGGFIGNCSFVHWGMFLEDGRFAFLIQRHWGDLRTLINLRLSDNNFQGPSFSHCEAVQIMHDIALGMGNLHGRGVLHSDLKHANVLIYVGKGDPRYSGRCEVGDYESSMLVQGTRFWRAREVLEDLMKKPCDRNVEIWTKKVDVYSYAMTCYEVLTGHIPFDGYVKSDWKRVIDGERPHLPDHIDVGLGELVERSWFKEPSKRPTFEAIEMELDNMRPFSSESDLES